jgi:hypothetical protein
MTHGEHVLRQADPLRHEAPPSDEVLHRLRRRAEDEARRAAPSTPPVSRRAALVSMTTIASVAIGAVVWQTMSPAGVAEAAAVRFELRLAESSPGSGLTRAVVGETATIVYLHPEVIATNDDILTVDVDGDGDGVTVRVTFSAAAASRLRAATGAHVGRPAAIVLDGRVTLAPVVASALGDTVIITGQYTRAEAERLAAGLMPR